MAAAPEEGVRQRDAERTRTEILDEATAEFARAGLAGARVDVIAARTRTTKRMLYYYFGSKQGLYLAVLERAYVGIRALERGLEVDDLPPAKAVRAVAELTFDHHEAHPDFIRLVAIENIHHAEHLRTSPVLSGLADPAVDVLGGILERGRAVGLFRDDVDALDVHVLVSSFCVFRVANRHTFSAIFGRDLLEPGRREHYRRMVGDVVVAYLTANVGRD
ncbi:Transcriptional regulator, TetR family [Pseudonocardia sp. Ae168_Ps1]|uniref:TetR family transcriptional regulator n=1 Tax=unclassified Pseudonocardia TaxID=2619320 RepID=UPI00094B38A3|nr:MULTISPECIES: TetR family transcriptional regulator [unclassified Pseudonocardia]OLL71943.1 Transcriptional regulator, TetR family [Pseudonocardia sp. Ae150A_Ps1]OLL77910.1 Transcriptional regulator, TetR family [Pseudonocardia sp. Ae168_Ps1]OLL87967.1 Transcriptional regulator, TetR family [Pseudonocardia sp. Ae263_Ps1]OLL92008.1 Transcriptional regulator, TetR family [Pseudonocardia sp. Ae356_Ps1]